MVASRDCSPDQTLPFVLRVASDGAAYRGAFGRGEMGTDDVVMDVNGAVQPDAVVIERAPGESSSRTVRVARVSDRGKA